MIMKRNAFSSVALLIVLAFMGACNSDAWDELPSPIANFISQYFPFGELESYSESDGYEIAKIKKGATLTFDSDYEWTDVNGNGAVLPQQFLYDKLPENLYRYLESVELQYSVYRVVRTPELITVDLLDTVITYNQKTGVITYPEGEGKTSLTISAEGN